MSGWYLQQISIEGFRGINNQGDPLIIKFKHDHINSISAANGVGKTSIFDAISYAITGRIPKLDDLPAVERGSTYYLNRFHTGNCGTVELQLLPIVGGNTLTVTITRNTFGGRTVSTSDGTDGNTILAELNREFVLLDNKTFQNFIDHTPQNRGRSFTGLLGLKRYSLVRQGLAGISNTRFFNSYFDVTATQRRLDSAKASSARTRNNISEAYNILIGEAYNPEELLKTTQEKAKSALCNISLLKALCNEHEFKDIDLNLCTAVIKAEEGGARRDEFTNILMKLTQWGEAVGTAPTDEDMTELTALATTRDTALEQTKGDAFRQMYVISEAILSDPAWEDERICPTCGRTGTDSVLDHVRAQIDAFATVKMVSEKLAEAWINKGWDQLNRLENIAKTSEEPSLWALKAAKGAAGTLSSEEVSEIIEWIKTLIIRATQKIEELTQKKQLLEHSLPQQLTEVIEKIDAAKRLQANIKTLLEDTREEIKASTELNRISRVKEFLDRASNLFAPAESNTSARRLAAIEPKARAFFGSIMCNDIVPALSKRTGSEDLSISLAKFWTLSDISAQAVLSESYRNAFAISVYLAAASLYGGSAKFIILDDVTSSFDSGHQFHLMNTIRSQFARPGVTDGPQVILLSHDPTLEKFFNVSMNDGGWNHQSLQGTSRTSVYPKPGKAQTILKDTQTFLANGDTDSAEPKIRQYLEFKLDEIIRSLKIPVPYDLALSSESRMVNNLVNAIKKAVHLHQAARDLVLDPNQISNITATVSSTISNYISHWSTGQTHTFTAQSLSNVLQAIDDFARCFQYEDPVGSGNYKYHKSLNGR